MIKFNLTLQDNDPAIITVAIEFYYNIFNPNINFVTLDDSNKSQAINKINNTKINLDLNSINYSASQLSERENNFVRVMHMRGPQLKNAIKNLDIISKYRHPDDCREEQVQVEILLKKTLLELGKENIDLIILSDLIKARAYGGKAQEGKRINDNHDRLNKLTEAKKK